MDPRAQVAELQRTFVPPSGLDGSRPREVVLTAGGRAVYVVAIALMVGALAAGIGLQRLANRQAEDRRAFVLDGVDADAVVTRLWRASGDSKQPWVSYGFTVTGVPYDGRSKIRLSAWQTLRVGSTVGIRYLPDQPGRNVLIGAEPGGVPPFVPFVVGLAFALGGFGLLVVINNQRRLLMEGRPAPAVVTGLQKHHTSHGGTHRTITYTFPLLSGAVATGKCDTNRKAPQPGSVICVVYDPDRPRRSQAYPFALVRPMRAAVEIAASRTSLS